jgi:hypothetical protein
LLIYFFEVFMDSVPDLVLNKLRWLRQQQIWPNGGRYLWTDAFGVVLLVSLYHALREEKFLDEAEWVVAEVGRVLGRTRGIRIGEAPDRDGQYFHYLAMWLFALERLGRIKAGYRQIAIDLARQIHPHFVVPGLGVYWKMQEDLSGPYPGIGFGALDAFQGYVIYRLLAPGDLAGEIAQMRDLVMGSYQTLSINQDLGLGMMLWLIHFFPDEPWALWQRRRSQANLQQLWVDPPGYFCRYPGMTSTLLAFSNYGVSVGLQALKLWPDRVKKLNDFFTSYRSGDEYDTEAITHVMACTSHFPGEFVKDNLLLNNGHL